MSSQGLAREEGSDKAQRREGKRVGRESEGVYDVAGVGSRTSVHCVRPCIAGLPESQHEGMPFVCHSATNVMLFFLCLFIC